MKTAVVSSVLEAPMRFLSALLFAPLLWFSPRQQSSLPIREILDTRQIQGVGFETDSLFNAALTALGEAYPRETVLCLYGAYEPEARRLAITRFEEAAITEATETSVAYECLKKDHLVGDLHSHPTATGEPGCWPSLQDFSALLYEDNILTIYIICANGWVYNQMKDGRWRMGVWRQPTR